MLVRCLKIFLLLLVSGHGAGRLLPSIWSPRLTSPLSTNVETLHKPLFLEHANRKQYHSCDCWIGIHQILDHPHSAQVSP
jgi:hypothetical protein